MNPATNPRALPRKSTRAISLRNEALRLMDGAGAILDTAREISDLMREAGISGAVIGGIAVVLHGHLRTTKDINILVSEDLQRLADMLTQNGFLYDRPNRAFVRAVIPIHLVQQDQVGTAPRNLIEIEGVMTVSLADLIEMKLRSGTKSLLLAQDLADVISLIRHHKLTGQYASRLEKELRPEFRKLARAIAREK